MPIIILTGTAVGLALIARRAHGFDHIDTQTVKKLPMLILSKPEH